MSTGLSLPNTVMPAKAGIHDFLLVTGEPRRLQRRAAKVVDGRMRGHDGLNGMRGHDGATRLLT